MRYVRIALRTAHIGAACMLLGAVHFADDPAGRIVAPWLTAVLVTGVVLVATELVRHGWDWLRFLQGWTVIAKLALVGVGAAIPEALPACLWAALILGSIISHAPGKLRQHPIWGEPGPCATKVFTGAATGAEPSPAGAVPQTQA